ncbi:outer membrane protein Iml2/Tetratricopeptide repeat protein 39 [Diaporthe sp. PMI_573]|nr:outer membrane protein Iml2/Tetratricopeptide repeat protein 39 [Diaporthaceae sp. PMI_573]
MRSWFKGSVAANSSKLSVSSSKNASSTQVADPRDVEASDLQDAMEAAARIVNDDIDGAESQLKARKDSSSFHQLGLGIAVFMRSILGFEKEIMAEAGNRLAECETRAWADMKKAQKQAEGGGGWFRGGGAQNGQGPPKNSQIYPPGSEYQLVNAEAQLMGAIISVMHESLTEGIRGFYKLRKAFVALDAIMEAESRIFAERKLNGAAQEPSSVVDASKQNVIAEDQKNLESDSDLEFVDAPEDVERSQAPAAYAGHLKRVNSKSAPSSVLENDVSDLALDTATTSLPTSRQGSPDSQERNGSPQRRLVRQTLLDQAGPDSSIFTNPVDVFVHSGANMCFGILLLIISMVPPAFSKLLYIIGFKGDRERGVQMLWQSTKFDNVNGGVAGLMLLGYYNGILAFADILPSEKDVEELADEGEIIGYPKEQCSALLQSMRSQYPQSGMWKVEEARNLANAQRVPEAVAMLKSNGDSKMRQVTALSSFELSTNALFMMDWVTMRDGFLRCIELNDWSHSLYYFFIASAQLEMYRDAVQAGESTEAKKHKKAAEEYFRKVPASAGRKKFLARQMPFEVFALRKVQKWEDRAKEYGIDFADAVGVSPAEEMTYLWSGSKRMSDEMFGKALAYLSWDRCTASKEHVEKMKAIPDEAAIKAVAESAILSNMGRYDDAREKVKPYLEQDRTLFKGTTRDDYTLPCAHYEMAVVAWKEACDLKCWPAAAEESDDFRQKKVAESQEYLDHVKTWESFVLDARIGMRVQTGSDSIAWLRRKKNWT